jgi:hypothetical protein
MPLQRRNCSRLASIFGAAYRDGVLHRFSYPFEPTIRLCSSTMSKRTSSAVATVPRTLQTFMTPEVRLPCSYRIDAVELL